MRKLLPALIGLALAVGFSGVSSAQDTKYKEKVERNGDVKIKEKSGRHKVKTKIKHHGDEVKVKDKSKY